MPMTDDGYRKRGGQSSLPIYVLLISFCFYMAGCSADGSAPALGAGCRRFESCHSDHLEA